MSTELLMKIRIKQITIYTILLIVFILITASFLIMYMVENDANYSSISFITMMIAVWIAVNLARALKTKIPKYRYIEVVKCLSCGYSFKKKPDEGDYILRDVGICPQCSGRLIVYGIYREKVE